MTAIADARACRSVYRYLNDPAEHARVDALREQRRVEDAVQRDQERIECLVRMELQSEERRQRAERTRFEMAAGVNLMHRLSMPMYQPAREPAPRTQQEKAERTEEYARLFFGVPLAVIRQEERTCNALPAYTKRTLVPPHLKALSYFKSQPPWLRKRLQPDAYLLTPKRFSWLYDTVQIEAIRAQHPLRRDYWPQQGYRLVTKSQLRKMGLKDSDIMVMLPVIEVETKYQGWIYMYEVPDP